MTSLKELHDSKILLHVRTVNSDFVGYFSGGAFDGTLNGFWVFTLTNGSWKVVRIEHIVDMEPT